MKPQVDYRELPVSERIQLVEDIWDSIADDAGGNLQLTPEESAEMEQRLEAHRQDPSSSLSWASVRESLFSVDSE